MVPGVMVDFDGTVTNVDASYKILERFADGDWYSVEEKAYSHEMTILEALKIQAGMIRVSPGEAESYLLGEVELREGFREFAEWCRSEGILLEICSDGFDFTIEMLLRNWGLDWIPFTSNRTIPSETGTTIEFPYHRPECPINANCKCYHLERMRESTGFIVFIGDGTTDECVSKNADVLFARDKLLEICRSEGVDCIPWDSWSGVLEKVKAIFSQSGEEGALF
jgi:2,3-diketo-5-methylthio-1-phosphopentane phosphatase